MILINTDEMVRRALLDAVRMTGHSTEHFNAWLNLWITAADRSADSARVELHWCHREHAPDAIKKAVNAAIRMAEARDYAGEVLTRKAYA